MKLTEKDKNLVMRALMENCSVLTDVVGEGEELDAAFELMDCVRADGVEANMDEILEFCENMENLHGPFTKDSERPIAQLCCKVYGLETDREPETSAMKKSVNAVLFDKIREKLIGKHELAVIDPDAHALVEQGFMDDYGCSITYGLQDKVIRIKDLEGTVLFMFDKDSAVPRMFKELFETIEGSGPYKSEIIKRVKALEDTEKLNIIWRFVHAYTPELSLEELES